jgi:hypothetical protein
MDISDLYNHVKWSYVRGSLGAGTVFRLIGNRGRNEQIRGSISLLYT